MPEPITLRRVAGDHPDAVRIVEACMAELAVIYRERAGGGTPAATPAELSPPGGAFVLVSEDGALVAGGGVRRLGDGLGEIKRMYVAPEARGRGHARRLLEALEGAARDLGYARLRLDTGPLQPRARALYESAGYAGIEDYNGNSWASFWGEKAL